MWFLLPLHYVRFNNFGVTGVRPLKKICKLVEGASTVHTAASINDEIQYSQYSH